ncbi:MAG TPA: hypothetical protein VGF45_02920 [Polyangia bacterium]
MIAPRPRKQVEYQKPRRINSVSVTLAAMMAATVWAIISFWPIIKVRSNVKSEIEEVMPRFWKLNLRTEAQAREELAKLRRHLTDRIRKVGVTDDRLELVFERNKKTVAISAHYKTVGTLRGWDRKFVFDFAPRAETDASRVEW